MADWMMGDGEKWQEMRGYEDKAMAEDCSKEPGERQKI
jgi:hypothetical protein